MEIGRHHPLLKTIRSLRRSTESRRESGCFVAEGLHLAAEALECGLQPDSIVHDPRLELSPAGLDLLARLRATGAPCYCVAPSVMDGLQEARSPQPLLLVLRTSTLSGRSWRDSSPPLIVVCDGIQEPGNLGAILRTADAAGAAALITTGDCADLLHPRTIRASMGSLFRLPVERRELADTIVDLRERGLTLIATAVTDGEDYRDVELNRACALFLGGEGAGFPADVAAQLDCQIRIPLQAGVESLSVGAAAAVLLFEAARQRRVGG